QFFARFVSSGHQVAVQETDTFEFCSTILPNVDDVFPIDLGEFLSVDRVPFQRESTPKTIWEHKNNMGRACLTAHQQAENQQDSNAYLYSLHGIAPRLGLLLWMRPGAKHPGEVSPGRPSWCSKCWTNWSDGRHPVGMVSPYPCSSAPMVRPQIVQTRKSCDP